MTSMKSIPALSFKRTCALNATSNESALIHFVSGKLCSHENLMPVWNFISVKLTIWNPYRFEFHFASIHVNTSKELTEHRSEIFNRNEISYWFEFISLLVWMYSYTIHGFRDSVLVFKMHDCYCTIRKNFEHFHSLSSSDASDCNY